MLGHPSAPVAPVVFAMGEWLGVSGDRVLEAFIAGVEVEGLLGLLVEPQHHENGWHTTATLGTFGAAAAAAKMLGLSNRAWTDAFGIAATQASGLKSMFGTMTKPLHAGFAARNGIFAARAAQRGLSAASNVLDRERGFIDVTTPAVFPLRDLPTTESFFVSDVLFKYHAACYLTHSTIEGILSMKNETNFVAEDVESVKIRALDVHATTCMLPEANTPLEAKFSLNYAAAIAISMGAADEGCFRQDIVSDPTIRALAQRVEVEVGAWDTPPLATPVTVTFRNGSKLARCVNVGMPARGSVEIAAQRSSLSAKFMSLVAPRVGAEQANIVLEQLSKIAVLPDLQGIVAGLRTSDRVAPDFS